MLSIVRAGQDKHAPLFPDHNIKDAQIALAPDQAAAACSSSGRGCKLLLHLLNSPAPQFRLGVVLISSHQIGTTIFWVGELPHHGDPGNLRSAWDPHWIANPPNQNAFYVALPYNDVLDSSHTKPEAATVVPWFRRDFVRQGQSVLRGRWIEIQHGGGSPMRNGSMSAPTIQTTPHMYSARRALGSIPTTTQGSTFRLRLEIIFG